MSYVAMPALPADFLTALSNEQRAAVTASDKYIRVIAGPGSGKTRVLTSRIAHLCTHGGVWPYEVLAITFTNKAAKEMQNRLAKVLGRVRARQIAAGTFHSFCVQVLRRFIEDLGCGYTSSFMIYDQGDAQAAFMQAVKETDAYKQLDNKDQRKQMLRTATKLLDDVSNIKNNAPSCFQKRGHQVVDAHERFLIRTGGKMPWANNLEMHDLAQAYDMYQAILRDNRALDFDDLLSGAVAVLQKVPGARQQLQARFKHILVDEFQDTNMAQYELVRLLTGEQGSLFVVGDPDQAIYGWRGAVVANMRESFLKDYAGAITLNLRDNYRSTPEILLAAERALGCASSMSPDRQPLVPIKASGPRVEIITGEDDREEAQVVIDKMKQLHGGREGVAYKDMAVLYRIHTLQRCMEEPLVRGGVPYIVVGGTKFWDKKEIKDVLAFLRLTASLEDGVALERIINVPVRGLGAKGVANLKAWAKEQGQSLGAALFAGHRRARLTADLNNLEGLPDLPPAKQLGLKAQAHAKVELFRRAIVRARCLTEANIPLDTVIIELLEDLDYEQHIFSGGCGGGDGKSDTYKLRWSNVQQLRAKAGDYSEDRPQGLDALRGFLDEVALLTDADSEKAEQAEGVRLMTVHAAKGLEFKVVFIVGCEEGILPRVWEDQLPEDLDEEIRLGYVGVTRAEERLYLCHAQSRALYGEWSRKSTDVSRMLAAHTSGQLKAMMAKTTQAAHATSSRGPYDPSDPEIALRRRRHGEGRSWRNEARAASRLVTGSCDLPCFT
ncbi:hypothetical protein WJX72_003081 [[Myrmecia] bisecta]|uniref:DNA 3'-5' helicase n=1 Tax=[Myrmecia] bisecta TaxID=41462 RepID=A0AAW1Q1D4_9CHLO